MYACGTCQEEGEPRDDDGARGRDDDGAAAGGVGNHLVDQGSVGVGDHPLVINEAAVERLFRPNCSNFVKR